jgi:pseudoazurin
MNKLVAGVAMTVALGLAGTAVAAEHEVQMLNKGEKGAMVFEPDFVRAEPGDTIRFVVADKGHNAESIKGMLPEGADAFKGKINKEVTITVTEDGLYGIKCAPHYGMGMVALIAVGDPVNTEEAVAVKHPGKAKKVFAELLGQQQFAAK